jgi:amidase
MIVKNQFATYNMNNTSGSTSLIGAKTGRDANVIKKLKEAGVIIIGISNLTQWGNNRNPPTAGNGWSVDGGQAIGIYIPNQDPWSSSTGSVTGTALGLAFAGLGTEVEGSITCAAERSNLVGLKPTAGLVTGDLVMVSK